MKFFKSKKQTSDIKDENNDYYQTMADWRYDKYESQTLWLNRSLIALAIIIIALLISLITNLMLFPLKEKVPFLYAVNETTGELTQIGQFQPEKFENNWLM